MILGERGMVLPTVAVAIATSMGACSGGDDADPDGRSSTQHVADPGAGEESPREDDAVETSFLRQTVTISAEIEEIVSPQAFWMGRDRLLVVSTGRDFDSTGAHINEKLVEDGVVVQVTGTVRDFELAAFEGEFGIDYDDELFASFEKQPVIVAEEINPLAGEPLTVAGQVGLVFSPVSFRLAGASWRIVVLDTDLVVRKGDFVEVTGSMRPLDPADLESDSAQDVDEALYDEYAGDLVFVADRVTATAPDGEGG